MLPSDPIARECWLPAETLVKLTPGGGVTVTSSPPSDDPDAGEIEKLGGAAAAAAAGAATSPKVPSASAAVIDTATDDRGERIRKNRDAEARGRVTRPSSSTDRPVRLWPADMTTQGRPYETVPRPASPRRGVSPPQGGGEAAAGRLGSRA